MTVPELDAVLARHAALNAGDAFCASSLSQPEIEGPRGPALGRQVLKDWVAWANICLEPLRSFRRGRTVVVEEAATWRDAQTGKTTGAATVVTVFGLDGGLVAEIFRYDDLEDALRSAGLDGSDEIRPE